MLGYAKSSRSVCDIIKHAHRKRIRFLEYHTHVFTQLVYIHLSVNIDISDVKFTLYFAAFHQVVHTVKAL